MNASLRFFKLRATEVLFGMQSIHNLKGGGESCF